MDSLVLYDLDPHRYNKNLWNPAFSHDLYYCFLSVIMTAVNPQTTALHQMAHQMTHQCLISRLYHIRQRARRRWDLWGHSPSPKVWLIILTLLMTLTFQSITLMSAERTGVEVSCEQTFIFLPQEVQCSSSRSMSQERLNIKSLLAIGRDHSDSLDLEEQSYIRSSFDNTERILHHLPSKDN